MLLAWKGEEKCVFSNLMKSTHFRRDPGWRERSMTWAFHHKLLSQVSPRKHRTPLPCPHPPRLQWASVTLRSNSRAERDEPTGDQSDDQWSNERGIIMLQKRDLKETAMDGPAVTWLGSLSSCVALGKSLWLADYTFLIHQMGIINLACSTSVESNPKTMIYWVLLYSSYQRTQQCTHQAWSCPHLSWGLGQELENCESQAKSGPGPVFV